MDMKLIAYYSIAGLTLAIQGTGTILSVGCVSWLMGSASIDEAGAPHTRSCLATGSDYLYKAMN